MGWGEIVVVLDEEFEAIRNIVWINIVMMGIKIANVVVVVLEMDLFD